jgi:hypothetical protein
MLVPWPCSEVTLTQSNSIVSIDSPECYKRIMFFPGCSCLILFFPDFFSVFLFVAPPHDCSSSGYVNETYNFSSNFPTLTSEVKTNMPHRILGKICWQGGFLVYKENPLLCCLLHPMTTTTQ